MNDELRVQQNRRTGALRAEVVDPPPCIVCGYHERGSFPVGRVNVVNNGFCLLAVAYPCAECGCHWPSHEVWLDPLTAALMAAAFDGGRAASGSNA